MTLCIAQKLLNAYPQLLYRCPCSMVTRSSKDRVRLNAHHVHRICPPLLVCASCSTEMCVVPKTFPDLRKSLICMMYSRKLTCPSLDCLEPVFIFVTFAPSKRWLAMVAGSGFPLSFLFTPYFQHTVHTPQSLIHCKEDSARIRLHYYLTLPIDFR